MKKQIRFGVFETNSSSTHSLCICTKEEYDKWIEGEYIFDYYNNKLIKKPEGWDEAVEKYDDAIEDEEGVEWTGSEEYDREDLKTYDEWYEDEYLKTYEEKYTSPSGDEIVIFGKYGYNY